MIDRTVVIGTNESVALMSGCASAGVRGLFEPQLPRPTHAIISRPCEKCGLVVGAVYTGLRMEGVLSGTAGIASRLRRHVVSRIMATYR
jgi:hypothetical protein